MFLVSLRKPVVCMQFDCPIPKFSYIGAAMYIRLLPEANKAINKWNNETVPNLVLCLYVLTLLNPYALIPWDNLISLNHICLLRMVYKSFLLSPNLQSCRVKRPFKRLCLWYYWYRVAWVLFGVVVVVLFAITRIINCIFLLTFSHLISLFQRVIQILLHNCVFWPPMSS